MVKTTGAVRNQTNPIDAIIPVTALMPEGIDPMANLMKGFTENARRVLSYAQEEAEYLQSSAIGTEHVLVGLVREEDGLAGKVLRDLGASKEVIQKIVEQIARSPLPRMSTAPPDLSLHVKRMLERSVDESRRAKRPMIDTSAILLGLLSLGDAKANSVLMHLRINPATVRQRLQIELESGAGDSQPAS
jgi:ATP-dependent Clp protease ATP-binding subunit ClpC